jgi:hypothetical protein
MDSGYGIVYFPQTWDLRGIECDPASISDF